MSKNAYQFISDNTSICVYRNRNIDMYDAIAYAPPSTLKAWWRAYEDFFKIFQYKLYYSNSNTTQEEAVIKVNKYRPNNVCTRQALNKKEQLIPVVPEAQQIVLSAQPVEFYNNFVDVLYKSATATLCKNKHGCPTQNIVAVESNIHNIKSRLRRKLVENGLQRFATRISYFLRAKLLKTNLIKTGNQ